MKAIWPVAAMILMFSLVFTLAPSAQQATSRKQADGITLGNLFDPKTVETVRGEVVNVEEFTLARGMPPSVKLTMKTENNEALLVFLGPQWYLEEKDFELQPKDKIEVKGSRAIFQGKPALIAAVVFKEDRILKLRNENGVPVWSPWILH
jgi:hypothetical protein